ncbi:MAG: adenylate/guanylate cyclase domain-containing protein [Maribacter sp.]|nr:adenylate/guanylate cyclase domain-containing protein [Maribacter sp.]
MKFRVLFLKDYLLNSGQMYGNLRTDKGHGAQDRPKNAQPIIPYIYMMVLHPRYKRYFRQTLSFGVIWLAFGLVYVFLEFGLLGQLESYPSTGNKYDFTASLLYTSLISFLTGLIQGGIEVLWLKRRFAKFSLGKKIVLKSIFYLSFLVLFLISLTLMVNAQRYSSGVFDSEVLESLVHFIREFAFWSVIIYTGVILNVALFFSEMEEYLGYGALHNYALGKYHRPKQEIRIFMFLDMKSSTTIAETMGHTKYFDLIKAYYADMTDAILETSGQIYQYVGDEIVVSWSKSEGLYQQNCIRCFEKIVKAFEKKKDCYLNQFGLVPEFKAGFHLGEVTTGEIGILKKDLIYTGDVLNTTARIQAECNTYDAKALISGNLLVELQQKNPIACTEIGALILRGKQEYVTLFSLVLE